MLLALVRRGCRIVCLEGSCVSELRGVIWYVHCIYLLLDISIWVSDVLQMRFSRVYICFLG